MTATNRLRPWSLALLACLLAATPTFSRAGLERVGPTMSSVGYPQWYQDATGLTLEFCSPTNQDELDGGHCLLLPGDTTVPESFPDVFADEHFYWAADAVGDWTYEGQSSRAALILGLEAAFAIDVTPGGQIVFGRLRIRVDDLPLSGTYTIYTPYGKYVFPNQVAGARLFFTEDIGINCTPGDFTCALQSNIGPFLLPSDTPGGAELPPVPGPAPGKLYIADPGRSGPVTGSPLPDYEVAGGGTRNPNLFRVEGPGGVLLFETTDFTLMGRLFSGDMPGRVSVDRASYARTAAAQRVDVFATGFPTREARLPAQPIVDPVAPELAVYSAPCGGTATPDGDVLPPYTAPAGVGSIPMARNGTLYWMQTSPPELPASVCVAHTNARNTSGQLAPVYAPAPLGDKVFVSEATYDPNAGTLTVAAFSADAVANPGLTVGAFGDTPGTPLEAGRATITTTAPPAKIRVLSDAHGSDEMQVTVVASTAATNQPPAAVADAAETLIDEPVGIAVLANDGDPDGDLLLVSAVTQPTNGAVVVDAGATAVTYTPNAAFVGADAFTYTVTDGRGGFSTTSVVVTVSAAANLPPVANPDAAVTPFQTPVVIAVLANDGDANGDALSVTAVEQPAAGGTVSTDGVLVAYSPPPGFSGIASFTYTVSDGRGGDALGLVIVTVRAAEVLAITRAQFRQPNEWRVDGTSTFEGATITIHAGATLDGQVIGTTTVAGGLFTFRSTTTGVPANTRVSVESTGGAVRLNQQVTIR